MLTTSDEGQRDEKDTRLHGGRLILARIVWGILATFYIGMFIFSLPGYVRLLQTSCTSVCTTGQLSTDTVMQIQHVGVSLGSYVVFNLAVVIIVDLLSFVIAAVLVWRRFDDWMAMLVALMLIGYASSSITNAVLLSDWFGPALASGLLNFSQQSDITILVFAFYLFPDGRFVPRWTRWIAILGFGISFFFLLVPSAAQSLFSLILYLIVLLSLVVAQVYRYRSVSTPTQRQQTKWVVYGLTMTIILIVSFGGIPELIFPALVQNGSLFSSISNILASVVSVLIPISFAVAILRYRLYDIDILINRTLVYVTLTATLGLIYFGCIFILQTLLRGIINQNSTIAIVVSTLAIYILFQPIRHRVQTIIDRRFYRHKYDAAKIVAAYNATLRNEVDLDQLREHLLAVMHETMQPSHVSLWVRQPN
jgi:hypothetical protein